MLSRQTSARFESFGTMEGRTRSRSLLTSIENVDIKRMNMKSDRGRGTMKSHEVWFRVSFAGGLQFACTFKVGGDWEMWCMHSKLSPPPPPHRTHTHLLPFSPTSDQVLESYGWHRPEKPIVERKRQTDSRREELLNLLYQDTVTTSMISLCIIYPWRTAELIYSPTLVFPNRPTEKVEVCKMNSSWCFQVNPP